MEEKKTIAFGKILYKLRKINFQSQEELAHFSNLDRTYISELERDVHRPGLESIFSLAVSLGMKPSELVKEIEESEENAEYLAALS